MHEYSVSIVASWIWFHRNPLREDPHEDQNHANDANDMDMHGFAWLLFQKEISSIPVNRVACVKQKMIVILGFAQKDSNQSNSSTKRGCRNEKQKGYLKKRWIWSRFQCHKQHVFGHPHRRRRWHRWHSRHSHAHMRCENHCIISKGWKVIPCWECKSLRITRKERGKRVQLFFQVK